MTHLEHLLTIGMEEAIEVAHRLSKCLRFGLHEVQPVETGGDGKTDNLQWVRQEYNDLRAVLGMIDQSFDFVTNEDKTQMDDKVLRIDKFLDYSAKGGTLQPQEDV